MKEEKSKYGEIVVGGWHVKKEVTIAQIVTLLTIVGWMIIWASDVESRFTSLAAEDRRIEQKADIVSEATGNTFTAYQRQTVSALRRIDRNLTSLGNKIDGKADK